MKVCVCVYVCERERESDCVFFVCERECVMRERECVSVCACVHVSLTPSVMHRIQSVSAKCCFPTCRNGREPLSAPTVQVRWGGARGGTWCAQCRYNVMMRCRAMSCDAMRCCVMSCDVV